MQDATGPQWNTYEPHEMIAGLQLSENETFVVYDKIWITQSTRSGPHFDLFNVLGPNFEWNTFLKFKIHPLVQKLQLSDSYLSKKIKF